MVYRHPMADRKWFSDRLPEGVELLARARHALADLRPMPATVVDRSKAVRQRSRVRAMKARTCSAADIRCSVPAGS